MDTNLPIGLNPEDSAALSKELNALLCDLHVFYQNVRGFHWNCLLYTSDAADEE